jgi:hypothetical protein
MYLVSLWFYIFALQGLARLAKIVRCDGNKSLYLVFVGVFFLSILDCF